MKTHGIVAQGFPGTSGNFRWVENFKIQFGLESGLLKYITDVDYQIIVSVIYLSW